MIKSLEDLVKKDDLENFKLIFNASPINSHHKEFFYQICFLQQKNKFLDFLEKKTSISEDKKIDIFIETVSRGIKIVDFNLIDKFDDMKMAQRFKINAEKLTSSQENDFLIKFSERFPITTMINLKKIMYGAFKNEKTEFVDHITKKELDKNILFYSALCAIKFGKRETFSHMLKNALKYNTHIIEDIKKIKENYLISMRGSSYMGGREDLESFIDKTLIETFALHLEEELPTKKAQETKTIKSRIKL